MTDENSIAPAISESDVRRLAELAQVPETSIGRLCEGDRDLHSCRRDAPGRRRSRNAALSHGNGSAKGYTGAYAPAGTAPTPCSKGPLRQVDSGPGLDVATPDGSTKTVKAVPCTPYATETDGTTTRIGIPGPVRRGDSRAGTTVGRSRR
jgi:hypothetical protein